ncbi:WD REPEAT PROTEIN [Salix purpurea]|uniref:WD REPEAT PROTEIN n=1 Tax=Salix purpurea TaxID=77065 RepID=A0A9Q0PEJ3_SALPP|nr:WD REPEAT PROTEIN [Salix purpurea]
MEEQQQKQSKWKLERGQYLGEISALCFLHPPSKISSTPFLLAGTGSQILLYNLESGKITKSFEVFDGIRVHGITCSSSEEESSNTPSLAVSFKIAVFGEKRLKLFNLYIQTPSQVNADLVLIHCLPKFTHWVLDVSFFKSYAVPSSQEERQCLAIGCSDNSVHLWDMSVSSVVLQVQSPEKCLLYSMRLWGDSLETLRIASGTIFNEIIVWKVVPVEPQLGGLPSTSLLEDDMHLSCSSPDSFQLRFQQHKSAHMCRLVGHEGSIFRLAWSSDGSKLVSVSDDRSARIWAVSDELKDSDNGEEEVAGPVLFGHNARVWDCCICDSVIVTAGEDCTCRVWRLDGKQLKMIKEHIAWKDKLNQNHLLTEWRYLLVASQNSSEYIGLMDSKSEYVRCLHFTCKDTLYVATNNGYLYHARLLGTVDVKWTKLAQLSEEVPIVCMDLLSKNFPKHSDVVDDWVALGDGKGNVTIVRIMGDVFTPEVGFTFTWSAGKERQLLGTYWCKELGCRFIFTADPRGILKLWRLSDPLPSGSLPYGRTFDVSLIAEFTSCFGIRIMCLDASFENEVLVCGDSRGNLVLFTLSKDLLQDKPTVPQIKISPLSYFKGSHGISTVSNISVAKLSSDMIEIRSTGGDGCICYLEYDPDQRGLEFIGMKQVKELSLVQSVSANNNCLDDSAYCGYAIGFASTDFIIWNLISEAKVVQIPCGGWRRPHSYYLGDVPEAMSCFAYVKDEIIYIHRKWVPKMERKIFPQNLHIQFHGREMHSLCFVSKNTLVEANGKNIHSARSSWIATGCEDGTVRLTRYVPGVEGWFTSKLLGEHVGGSAVRSICPVSKMHIIASDLTNLSDWTKRQNTCAGDIDNPFLLISVGSKQGADFLATKR